MTRYLVDGKEPGQFKARCALTKHHVITDLPHYLRREYEERGWAKGFREVYSKKHRRTLSVECYLEPLCAGFETTDRVAFVEHMKTVHGKRTVNGEWETFARSIRAGWRPSLTSKALPKDAAAVVETCRSCGLVAEVDDRPANVLWWAEHERMCVGDELPQVGDTVTCIQVGHCGEHPARPDCLLIDSAGRCASPRAAAS